MKRQPLTIEQLEHLGSLITIKGTNSCLGDLMFFDGHGCFCPNHGKVPVTKEQAKVHNKCLDEARLKGLDENCQIGQGDFAYLTGTNGARTITTFSGTLISSQVTINGSVITFRRADKVYRGRMGRDTAFNYRRVK